MFLKRSLVMVVGVLLFIGGFLLKFHLSAAHLESTFQNERVKYGVDGVVLTLPEASPPIVPVTPVSTNPDSSASAAAPDSANSTSPSSDSTPAPGSTSDPAVIIGPMPPANSTPDTVPAPDPVPAPDTNGTPMPPPPSSTMIHSRSHGTSFLVMAAYRPEGFVHQIAQLETTDGTNGSPTTSLTATNSSAPSGATNAAEARTATITTSESKNSLVRPTGAPLHSTSVGDRAIVLGYHQFTGPGIPSKNIYSMSQDVFESEMKYLRDNGYHVVPLSDVVAFVKHKKTLPPDAVAITIDDGYKSALNYAAPVLKQYGYPWTYFVYPQFITKTEGKGAASWPDLLELDKEGVDVECHSMTHPILTSHTQKFKGPRHLLSPTEYDEFLTDETSTAKALLEQNLGKKIKYFAYPYGAYNKTVEAKAIAAGFEAVFTVADNPVHITTDVYSIGRYIITKPVERAFAGYLRQGALGLAEVDPEPGATTSNPRPVITAVLGFNGDPASLETEVRDFGVVRHDFDPQTSTVRLYLPRDLIQPEVLVSIQAKDSQTGQTMVANWHFNYEPAGGAPLPAHGPMPTTAPAPEGESKVLDAPRSTVTEPTNPAPVAAPAAPTTNVPSKSPATTP